MTDKWVQGFGIDPTNPEHMKRLLEQLEGQPCVLCGAADAPHIHEFVPKKEERAKYAPGDVPPSQVHTIHTPMCSDCHMDFEMAPEEVGAEVEKAIARKAAISRGEQ